ncbi:MAG: alpha-hydroxy-acid oxidizing protein [Baekduiaceae bacterium]
MILIGRPVAWALAAQGEGGVAELLAQFAEDVERALALCGCPDVAAVTRGHVQRAAW